MRRFGSRVSVSWLAMVVVLVVGCSPSNEATPFEATFESRASWWTSVPDLPLSTAESVRITLSFTNDTEGTWTASEVASLQLWANDDGGNYIGDVPATYLTEPSTVAPGATFAYDLIVDGSVFTRDMVSVSVRPESTELGSIGPDKATLIAGTVTEE